MNRWAVFCCALVDEVVLLSVKFIFPNGARVGDFVGGVKFCEYFT